MAILVFNGMLPNEEIKHICDQIPDATIISYWHWDRQSKAIFDAFNPTKQRRELVHVIVENVRKPSYTFIELSPKNPLLTGVKLTYDQSFLGAVNESVLSDSTAIRTWFEATSDVLNVVIMRSMINNGIKLDLLQKHPLWTFYDKQIEQTVANCDLDAMDEIISRFYAREHDEKLLV